MSKNKLTKEDRLSFRIRDEVSDDIDKYVKKYSTIKDRSKFGILAAEKYLEHFEIESELMISIREAITSLADKLGASDLDEVKNLLGDIE